ncbi:hypothetical protein [Flintibacter porci]|uniref:hypothetical protein n=1 Tax=Flintibacter porci TaxID=3342383 RepID=UPI003F8BBBD1
MMVERRLELTFRIDEEHVEVDVYEPESGEVAQFEAPFSGDEHPEFDQQLGEEIYSWLSLWAEEANE